MKKTMMALIALVLMITLTASALASSELVFTRRNFHGGQMLPVYRGPGHEYGRGANGWAKASTNDAVYAAGKENGWALIMYETNDGAYRVGYVDLEQFHYNISVLKLEELDFSYCSASIYESCTLTDDPVLNSRTLGILSKGQTVTYLGSFYMHRYWGFIETWIDGKPIRGFVPLECLSM